MMLAKAARVVPLELRLGDLATLFSVQRCGSLTGAARELGVTTSQVSKAIGRLEQRLRLTLFRRTPRGVMLTDDGLRVLPHLDEVLRHLSQVLGEETPAELRLSVAAPSYLLALLLPVIAATDPERRLCGLELPPAALRAQLAENRFQLALLPGEARLPSTWDMAVVGQLRKTLWARPALAARLGPQPIDPARLRAIPFVRPVHTLHGQSVPVDDDCPLPASDRRAGHEVQTLTVALELAACSDQLVYGPAIAGRRHVLDGQLVELAVRGWDAREPLLLACDAYRVRSNDKSAILAALRAALRTLDGQAEQAA